jgi:hypothetical protein
VRTRMLSSILAVVCLASVAGADQVERTKRGDNEARAILERSAEFISAAERFEVEAEVSYDVNRAMGSLIESGSTRRITVVRPDRVRVEVARRDGSHLQLVFDGKEMTVHRSRDDVYAKQAIKGGLDSVVDTIIAQIGVRPPLMDLLYSNLWAVLRPRIVAGESHGKAIIGGVECTHLSFQDFDLDWEIWIENGERPLPRRIRFIEARPHQRGQRVMGQAAGRFSVRSVLVRLDQQVEIAAGGQQAIQCHSLMGVRLAQLGQRALLSRA